MKNNNGTNTYNKNGFQKLAFRSSRLHLRHGIHPFAWSLAGSLGLCIVFFKHTSNHLAQASARTHLLIIVYTRAIFTSLPCLEERRAAKKKQPKRMGYREHSQDCSLLFEIIMEMFKIGLIYLSKAYKYSRWAPRVYTHWQTHVNRVPRPKHRKKE